MKSNVEADSPAPVASGAKKPRHVALAAFIFIVGFGLFAALLAHSHVLNFVVHSDVAEASEIAAFVPTSSKTGSSEIIRNVGRLKYNAISVALRDTGVVVDTNNGHVLVSYVDEGTTPDTITVAAQRSRALASELDSDRYKDATVVATDADGNVRMAVTNKTGIDESAVATSDLLGQSQSYVIAPELYSCVTNPSYERSSDDTPRNVNMTKLDQGSPVEVTTNAVAARIDATGTASKIAGAAENNVEGVPAVSVVDAAIPHDDSATARTDETKTSGSASTQVSDASEAAQ